MAAISLATWKILKSSFIRSSFSPSVFCKYLSNLCLKINSHGYLAKKLMGGGGGDSLQAIVMTKALPIVSAGYTTSECRCWHGFVYSMEQGGSYLQ